MQKALFFDEKHILNKFSKTQLHSLYKKREFIKREWKQGDRSPGMGFTQLPYQKTSSHIKKMAQKIRQSSDAFLVIGIGGSSLGAKAAIHALGFPKKPAIHFLENPNPATLDRVLKTINLRRTTVNVISKSGTTLETLCQFFIVYERLKKVLSSKQLKDRIIVTSEPDENFLTDLASQNEWNQLSVPMEVEGRYSVLSAVGLLPMAVAGISIDQVLQGAQWMDKHRREALQYGTFGYGAHHVLKKPITVLFPYDDRLKIFGEWFSQIWAESLAKSEKSGPTPVTAIGAIDQHSLLQLFLEGPRNKWYTTIGIRDYQNSLKVPRTKLLQGFSYLRNRRLSEILQTEQKVTEASLTKYQNPLYRISLPSLSAYSLGALFYYFELATVAAAHFYRVNPFDQPAIEEGKLKVLQLLKNK